MSKKVLITQEGFKELQDELNNLKEVKRVEIAERLKEAISFGDLAENSEYEDARNEQAHIEMRIQEIEEILKNFELVKSKVTEKKVGIGSFVTIVSTMEHHKGEKETFKIVGTTEADIYENKISNESPLGNALLGKTLGEKVIGKSPSGEFSYKIEAIK
ncbi:transcription elongation factor GreA [Candidatus Gracilibacteria bacterium]|nr:transcription elongation factor GreA [Candidatus Gracilibacteria bacterium]